MENKAKAINIDLGIKKNHKGEILQSLSTLLASTYVFGLKVQGVHWNIVGPHFYSLHKLTEELYTELFKTGDEIAERIRALGQPVPATYGDYIKLSMIEEMGKNLNAEEMLKQLLADYETLARFAKESFKAADEALDIGTADFVTQLCSHYEKSAWMLRATIC
jgi:starvation-inducible DNA-binding protein